MPGEHRHPGDLADTTGQYGVAEQADAEGREDVPMLQMGRRQSLVENDVPGQRPHDDGDEVRTDRRRDPDPFDLPEGITDHAEIGATPDEHAGDEGDRDEQERDAPAPSVEEPPPHGAAAPDAGSFPVSPR